MPTAENDAPVCTCIRGGHAYTSVAECPTHSAEKDVPGFDIYVDGILVWSGPGERTKVISTRVIPPG